MDPLRYKRPGQQKPSQTPTQTFGNSVPAPKAMPTRTVGVVPAVTPRMAAPRMVVSQYAMLARQQPIDMDLPGEADSHDGDSIIKRRRGLTWQKFTLRATAVLLVLVLTLGGLVFSQSYLKLHKVFNGSAGTAAALRANVAPDLLKGEGSGRVNVLLLGRGGGNHDGPDLTDTLMLASIDPVNHTTTLLSIPRDLWVNVPNQGVMKINAAWETGEFKYIGKVAPGSTDPKAIQAGFDMVDQTVSQVLGVSINYNVLVDFQAFKQAVDTVGGITVNVPTDLVDPTMAWENGGNPILAKAGTQNFNGDQALRYVRSRETTSDFARAARQRVVLLSLKDKIDTLGTLSNPLKMSGLLDTFGNNVATDISLSDANRMYGILKGIDPLNISSLSLDDTNNKYVSTGNINGQSVVIPKAGLFNYSDIQSYVAGQLKDPYILKENARVMILNGTSTAGLATTKSDELKALGYNVVGTANTPTPGWTHSEVISLNSQDKYTKNYLERRFAVTAQNSLPDNSIQTNGADFVIIIGSDEVTATQN